MQLLEPIFSHICFHDSFKICTEDLNRWHNWKQKQFKHAVFTQAMTRQIKPPQNNSSTTTAVAGMQYSLWLECILKQQAVQWFTAVIKLCLECRWKWPQCLLRYMSIHIVHTQNIISNTNHSNRCSVCFTNQANKSEWMMLNLNVVHMHKEFLVTGVNGESWWFFFFFSMMADTISIPFHHYTNV